VVTSRPPALCCRCRRASQLRRLAIGPRTRVEAQALESSKLPPPACPPKPPPRAPPPTCPHPPVAFLSAHGAGAAPEPPADKLQFINANTAFEGASLFPQVRPLGCGAEGPAALPRPPPLPRPGKRKVLGLPSGADTCPTCRQLRRAPGRRTPSAPAPAFASPTSQPAPFNQSSSPRWRPSRPC
jgi:hypothetical protein